MSGSAERRRKRTKPEDPRSLRGFADVSCLGPRLRGITPPARETRVSEWLSLVSRVPVALPLLRLEPRCSKLESAPDTTSVDARSTVSRAIPRVFLFRFLFTRQRRSFEFESYSRYISPHWLSRFLHRLLRDPGDIQGDERIFRVDDDSKVAMLIRLFDRRR